MVDQAGNQLPYIDGITMTGYQDREIEKLNILAGKVDYIHGGFGSVELTDVAELRRAQPETKLEVLFWDSGSGTGWNLFLQLRLQRRENARADS